MKKISEYANGFRRLIDDEIAELRELSAEEVKRPGKFEGAPIWAPFFFAIGLSGFADDEDETGGWVFDVEDEDRRIFPELKKFERIVIRVDTLGLVRGEEVREDAGAGEEESGEYAIV
jgi:hypothetical protein